MSLPYRAIQAVPPSMDLLTVYFGVAAGGHVGRVFYSLPAMQLGDSQGFQAPYTAKRTVFRHV